MGKVGMLAVSLVKDVMSEAVAFVRADTTAAEAAEVLTRQRINGAPVLGDHGRVVGVVSKTDLLDPRRAGEGKTVEDVMTRMVFAVRASDPAMQAVRLMVEEDIHRVLVVNDDGTLAGIVTPMDVLRGLTKGLSIAADSRAALEFVDLRTLKNGVRVE